MSNQFKRTPTCGENDVDLRVATEPRRVTDAVLSQIIATKDGEIAALTAEVTHLAEKLAERDAKVGSAGNDPVFRNILDGWLGADGEVYKRLVAYIDGRAAIAPSVERNNADGLNGGMHDSIFVKVWGDAGGGDDGRRALARYAYNIGFADRAKIMRNIDPQAAALANDAAPQPVDAAQAVPEWMPIETAPKDGRTLLLGRFNSMGNWRTLRGQWFTKEVLDDEWEETEGFEAGWYETAVEPDAPNCWETSPTHWRPLPAAPVAQPTDTTKGA